MRIGNLLKNKKGMGGVNAAIGIVILIVVIAVLAPMIFGTDGLSNAAFLADSPDWLPPLLVIMSGIALVKLVLNNA